MPKKEAESVRKPKRQAKVDKSSVKVDRELSDSNVSEDEVLVGNSKTSPHGKFATKRKAVEDSETGEQVDFTGEISHMLKSFGSDMNKIFTAKRKRLEQCTQESMRNTTKKIMDATKLQSSQRKKRVEEFRKQMNTLIEQLEADLERGKEIDEKLQKLIVQNQRHAHQLSVSCNNRLKAMKALGDQFLKGMDDLESHHQRQYHSANNELVKEMIAFQQKILKETQQQDMLNVRRYLRRLCISFIIAE